LDMVLSLSLRKHTGEVLSVAGKRSGLFTQGISWGVRG
jgi:hypothetical protein